MSNEVDLKSAGETTHLGESLLGPSDERQLYNDNHVWILGAGFSVALGVPAVAGFLDKMRDASLATRFTGDDVAFRQVFEFRRRAAAASLNCKVNLEDIEELFSLASSEFNASGSGSDFEQGMRRAIAATIEHCQIERSAEKGRQIEVWASDPALLKESRPEYWRSEDAIQDVGMGPIGSNHPRQYKRWIWIPDSHIALLGMLGLIHEHDNPGFGGTGVVLDPYRPSSRTDTILTFNYDRGIEWMMQGMGIPLTTPIGSLKSDQPKLFEGRPFGEVKGVELLKLHGSITWGTLNGQPESRLVDYETYSRLVSGSSGGPQLMPPTWRKNPTAQLQEIWNKSLQAIARATTIHVIGFSFPETDLHFRYLLANGLRDNVSLRRLKIVNIEFTPTSRATGEAVKAQLNLPVEEVKSSRLWMRMERVFSQELLASRRLSLSDMPAFEYLKSLRVNHRPPEL